jgi:membrane protease YdiL (CAAX protease family)
MLIDWIIFILLLIMPVLSLAAGQSVHKRKPQYKIRFYLHDILFCTLMLVLFLALKPSLYTSAVIDSMDKGFHISRDIHSHFWFVFIFPFVMSFTPWHNMYPKDISTAKTLFAFPVAFLPNNLREYGVFVCYIISGVFFEELLFRQFMFYTLNAVFHLYGDLLVVVSALIFALIHIYQGWKGIASSFVLGLILGKIFLMEANLLYPIALHLALNLTLPVLAFRRMWDLRKIKLQ